MALSRELMKRIEALNAHTTGSAGVTGIAGVPPAVNLPNCRRDACDPSDFPSDSDQPNLEEAVPGFELTVPRWGTAYCISTALSDFGAHWDPLRKAFAQAVTDAESPLRRRMAARKLTEPLNPGDVLLVDLETTGLAQTPLFLIGTLYWEGGDLLIRQFLARDYGEEAAAMALFLELAAEKRLLVSFNGKSFDMPYVRLRAIANALPCALEHPHLDLLHECRRIWRGTLPNCKLQTLEQYVCGRPPRLGDIPGSEIPEAYHAFVRTQHAGRLAQIIKHNLLDLVTLAELMTKLPPMADGSESQGLRVSG